MSYSAIPAALEVAEHALLRADLARLRRTVVMANELYQAGRYSGAGELLPGAIVDAQLAARELRGVDRQAAFRVLAETYHITSKVLMKVSETELGMGRRGARPGRRRAGRGAAAGWRKRLPLGPYLLRAGRIREATDLTMDAAAALAPAGMRSQSSWHCGARSI